MGCGCRGAAVSAEVQRGRLSHCAAIAEKHKMPVCRAHQFLDGDLAALVYATRSGDRGTAIDSS